MAENMIWTPMTLEVPKRMKTFQRRKKERAAYIFATLTAWLRSGTMESTILLRYFLVHISYEKATS